MPDDTTDLKKQLYGRYQEAEDKRQKLGLKVAHKALDIPEDDMQINANKTTNGVGAKGLIGVALAAGLPAAGLATAIMLKGPETNAAVPTPTVPIHTPADKSFDAIYEEQQPDGSWKITKRERLK